MRGGGYTEKAEDATLTLDNDEPAKPLPSNTGVEHVRLHSDPIFEISLANESRLPDRLCTATVRGDCSKREADAFISTAIFSRAAATPAILKGRRSRAVPMENEEEMAEKPGAAHVPALSRRTRKDDMALGWRRRSRQVKSGSWTEKGTRLSPATGFA